MQHLIIIGARGFGREVYSMACESQGYESEFDIKGFLDDKADALDGKAGYPPILNSVENYQIQTDDVFICALGDVQWKKHYAEIIINKGGLFTNLVHHTAFIGPNTNIGKGAIIASHTRISCDVTIGDFVTFQPYSIVGHDARVGNYCHMGVRSFMGGFSSIDELSTMQTGSILLPHIAVGRKCVIGAGSVVIKKVKDETTVYGNPAKTLKF